jgi:hypothetical protein
MVTHGYINTSTRAQSNQIDQRDNTQIGLLKSKRWICAQLSLLCYWCSYCWGLFQLTPRAK